MQWLAYFVDDKVGPCQFLNPGGVEFRRVSLPGMVQSLRKEGSMAKGRKRMVNPCTCGCAKKDHWRGEGWCGQCGCTWWDPRNPKAYAAKLERERKKRIKTVGDAIREHMAVVAEGGDGTEEWREFLGL